VIVDESIRIGRTPSEMKLYRRYQLNPAGRQPHERITHQMRSVKLTADDVLVL
jgi:hypothetical protein